MLAPFLPPKLEYVLFVNLSDLQIKLYNLYLKERSGKFREESGIKTAHLFTDFQELQRICTHPRVLLNKSIIDKEKQGKRVILCRKHVALIIYLLCLYV